MRVIHPSHDTIASSPVRHPAIVMLTTEHALPFCPIHLRTQEANKQLSAKMAAKIDLLLKQQTEGTEEVSRHIMVLHRAFAQFDSKLVPSMCVVLPEKDTKWKWSDLASLAKVNGSRVFQMWLPARGWILSRSIPLSD